MDSIIFETVVRNVTVQVNFKTNNQYMIVEEDVKSEFGRHQGYGSFVVPYNDDLKDYRGKARFQKSPFETATHKGVNYMFLGPVETPKAPK